MRGNGKGEEDDPGSQEKTKKNEVFAHFGKCWIDTMKLVIARPLLEIDHHGRMSGRKVGS